ncbi:hypothetical protein MASR1M32_34660 [Rhodobacter sp.]
MTWFRPQQRSLRDRLKTDPVQEVWASLCFTRNHSFNGSHDPGEEQDVARALMRPVRHNAILLADRLSALGWHALTPAMVSPPTPRPFPGEAEAAAFGPLPLALTAFWEVVGGLNFVWDYARGPAPDLFGGLTIEQLDPLWIDPPETLLYNAREWQDFRDAGELEDGARVPLDLAPDAVHKANISGGSPYGIRLPDPDADPMFIGDDFALRFTAYLRLAFRWGGFPGLAALPRSAVADARVAMLTEGFLPF